MVPQFVQVLVNLLYVGHCVSICDPKRNKVVVYQVS